MTKTASIADHARTTGALAYRQACARAALSVVPQNTKAAVEVYANSEYWAGWNAAIQHAAFIAENRHSCWKESSVGSSQPECDVSACEDIAIAIRFQMHTKPPVSRPSSTPERG